LADLERQKARVGDDIKNVQGKAPVLWILILGLILLFGGIAGSFTNSFFWIASGIGLLLVSYWAITRNSWNQQLRMQFQKANELERLLKRIGKS